MTIDKINTVAVMGAGTMGQGIAQVCASYGYKVLLYDVQPELISKGVELVHQNLTLLMTKGKLDEQKKVMVLNNILPTSDFRQVQADIVIEAVIEKLEVKQTIFAELEKQNERDCVFATNTSSIPVTQIASSLKYPERFAGLHFFNPAPVMKLVEVIKGAATSIEIIDTLKAFASRIGKEAVEANDSPGFIVNRVARHFYVESLKLLEENVADVLTIDRLAKASGFRMGPFELMDLIGIDTNFSVTSSMYEAFHQDPKFRPSRIQQQKVAAGHLGKKSGEGFYKY